MNLVYALLFLPCWLAYLNLRARWRIKFFLSQRRWKQEELFNIFLLGEREKMYFVISNAIFSLCRRRNKNPFFCLASLLCIWIFISFFPSHSNFLGQPHNEGGFGAVEGNISSPSSSPDRMHSSKPGHIFWTTNFSSLLYTHIYSFAEIFLPLFSSGPICYITVTEGQRKRRH